MANTHSLDLEASSSQYASITDVSQTGLDLTTDFTIEAWVQFESNSTNQPIAYKFQSAGDERAYAFVWSQAASELRLSISSDGTSANTTTQGVSWSPSTATWYHVAVVYDVSAGEATFYVNGIQQGATQTGGKTSINNSSAAFIIGKDGDSGSTYFDGLIDDVRVWSDTRSEGEIQQYIARELAGTEGNLVGYWKLNNDYTDETSNGNDLTASGSPVFSTETTTFVTREYQSIQTASATNASSVTVTKPTSLASGDLMLAVVSNGGKNDPATAATLSGWTQVTNSNDTTGSFNLDVTTLAKIADASDVAASNFTFDVTNTTDVVLGAILRFTGPFSTVAATTQGDADDTGAGGANTYTGGVIPDDANPILVNVAATGGGNSNTHTAYGVANSDPAWTEVADFGTNYNDGSTNDFLYMGIGIGYFAPSTTTGNYSNTNSDVSVDNAHGALISVNDSPTGVSVDGGLLTITSSIPAFTAGGGAAVTAGVITLASSLQAPTVSIQTNDWTYESLPTPSTWTYES